MPNFILSRADTDDVIAYILSLKRMQNNSLSTTCPHSESNLHRKIVPDVWPDLIRLKDQLGAFATQLSDVFNHLTIINRAIFNAQEIEQFGAFAIQLTDLADSLKVINGAIFQAQEIVECLFDHDLVKTPHVVASDQSIE
jgi:hypothetical protein